METQRGKTQKRKKRRRKKNEARESLRERREGKEGEREGRKTGPFAQNYSGEKQAQQTHIDNGRWHIKAS